MVVGNMTNIKAIVTRQRKRDQKEEESGIEGKISREIEKLDKGIMISSEFLQSSMDILIPDCK